MEQELPLGFAMVLAQNEAAMARFEALTQAEKQAVLRRTHMVSSKQEMRRLVASLCQPDEGWTETNCCR
ncbi:MAG: hypothetical protein LUF80_04155 [Oscillospiraceae bacterium]|nr:hypothetical protein [Oscillospiraceae bacterium]